MLSAMRYAHYEYQELQLGIELGKECDIPAKILPDHLLLS